MKDEFIQVGTIVYFNRPNGLPDEAHNIYARKTNCLIKQQEKAFANFVEITTQAIKKEINQKLLKGV